MHLFRTLIVVSISLFFITLSNALGASDGRLEINQTCAVAGCFPGDDPGFPVQVTEPGSYVLTGNLTGPEGAHGIQVFAAHATVDLNGFALVGPDSGVHSGIDIVGVANVEIRNGTVQDFGGGGVNCSGECFDLRAMKLRLLSNGAAGLSASGSPRASARDVVATGNMFDGIILTGNSNVVSGCTIVANGARGIRTGAHSLVSDNVVYDNGTHGIQAGAYNIVIGNVVTFNGEHGINLDTHALVKNNLARLNNQSAGAFEDIETCAGCTLIDNDTP